MFLKTSLDNDRMTCEMKLLVTTKIIKTIPASVSFYPLLIIELVARAVPARLIIL